MFFYSDTWGLLDLPNVVEHIKDFVLGTEAEIIIAVATDSQVLARGTKFVSVITVYRLGQGGQYYRLWETKKQKIGMHERIRYETIKSLQIASELNNLLQTEKINYNFEVHLDCGWNGDSKVLINELSSKVCNLGYEAKIKPDSYAASWVANKYTKSVSNSTVNITS